VDDRNFWIGKTIWLRILHDKLRLKEFHFRWVPHILPVSQKAKE
jgi:hypothetical protein